MRRIPILETQRLTIRPFVMDDLLSIHRILDLTFGDGTRVDDPPAMEESRRMLQWRVLNEEILRHVIATTEHDNVASQAVMRKLGMRIERNPTNDPPWLQVVGVLENTLTANERCT